MTDEYIIKAYSGYAGKYILIETSFGNREKAVARATEISAQRGYPKMLVRKVS